MADSKERTAKLSGHDLSVYTATWCPDCTRLKTTLQREGLKHRVVDIESVEGAADRLVNETGKRAIPFILVDDKEWVRGYHKELPQRLDYGLLLTELEAAVAKVGPRP